MAELAFTQAFLRRSFEVEKVASTTELELLDRTLARIVQNPYLPERFPTFYDPQHPTFLIRADPFLIEFAVDEEADRITFVSLFYRR
ncbi:MAG: hypothetical protein HYV04_05945 [Deltaproteobacteria bacterium]|nr:hypothetical protein [Deltaproteobacteria bacterium]